MYIIKERAFGGFLKVRHIPGVNVAKTFDWASSEAIVRGAESAPQLVVLKLSFSHLAFRKFCLKTQTLFGCF